MSPEQIERECLHSGLGVVVDDEGVIHVEEARVIVKDNETATIILPDGSVVEDLDTVDAVVDCITGFYEAAQGTSLYLSS